MDAVFYVEDSAGRLRPATDEELAAHARAAYDSSPEDLADEYLDHRSVRRVEAVAFLDRFAASVFTYRAASEVLVERTRTARMELADPSRCPDGWRAEWEFVLIHRIAQLDVSRRVAGAAAVLAASSATELLIDDLTTPTTLRRPGLRAKVRALLEEHAPADTLAEEVTTVASVIADRRNTLAHELDGSLWSSHDTDLSPTAVDDAFHDIGRFALLVNDVIDADCHRSEGDFHSLVRQTWRRDKRTDDAD